MKRPAFTLVELLVVIAIIALLMAILMPALRAARDQAKRVHCVSNVKTLALAWYMYQDENDAKLVGGDTRTNEDWVATPAGNSIEDKKEAIRKGKLFPFTGKTVDVYRCPADFRLKDPAQYAFRSFSIAGGANGEDWAEYNEAKTYLDLKNAATRYIFVEEIDPRGDNIGSWQMNVKSKTWVDPMAMWHKERSTIGYADGHAEMHPWTDKSFIEWCKGAWDRPGSFTFGMTPPSGERTDIEFMATGFPYKSLK
jgi:prepilin-type N-terminal cleavage/methylation domain-containing protein/prepilin-type processing-associated H-X9-DG protein